MCGDLLLRVTRSATFAAVCVTLAACAHVAGGGVPPGIAVLGIAFAAVLVPATALAGRERTLRVIAPVLLAAQGGLHLLFEATSGTGTAYTTHAAHVASAVRVAHAAHGCGSGTVMTLAHLWATLVTAWWLARGEALLWTLVRMAAHTVAHAVRPPRAPRPLSPRAVPVVPARTSAPPPRNPARTPVRRRGPPRPRPAARCAAA